MKPFKYLSFICFLVLLLITQTVIAKIDGSGDIFDLDLEELMKIEVISTSKKPQSVLKAAAAIHVISQDDIRRSGATTLPDVFRGVPGMQVAQVDANKWAVSIRGFNNRFATKTLVMIDGRTIYTPLFSGVYWNMHDMMLDDIERIEIVRGPGGTLWGANAVNGVSISSPKRPAIHRELWFRLSVVLWKKMSARAMVEK